MKIHTYNRKKGFIALFFTLSISSILMSYVIVSSTAIFDFIRMREEFLETRLAKMHILQCADEYIDAMVRSTYSASVVSHSADSCSISHIKKEWVDKDTYKFSFKSEHSFIQGTVRYGRVYELRYSNFSL